MTDEFRSMVHEMAQRCARNGGRVRAATTPHGHDEGVVVADFVLDLRAAAARHGIAFVMGEEPCKSGWLVLEAPRNGMRPDIVPVPRVYVCWHYGDLRWAFAHHEPAPRPECLPTASSADDLALLILRTVMTQVLS